MQRLVYFQFIAIVSFLLIPSVSNAGYFTDVQIDHWGGGDWYIDKLYSEGFIEGYPDDTFKRDRPITRYELAMIVCRINARLISELDTVDPELGWTYETMLPVSREIYFSDVPMDHWASYAVALCDLNGYMVGDDCGRFNGDDPVTVLQFAVIMDRLGSRLDLVRPANNRFHEPIETGIIIDGIQLNIIGADVLGYIESNKSFREPDIELDLMEALSRDDAALTIPRVWDRMVFYLEERYSSNLKKLNQESPK